MKDGPGLHGKVVIAAHNSLHIGHHFTRKNPSEPVEYNWRLNQCDDGRRAIKRDINGTKGSPRLFGGHPLPDGKSSVLSKYGTGNKWLELRV